MDNEELKIEYLKEAKLDETPEFYFNLTNGASIQRLRNIDAKINLPYVVEFFQGSFKTTSDKLFFKHKYKKAPLVLGLYEADSLGGKFVRQLLPNNQNMVITNLYAQPGTNNFPMTVGYKYFVRVYNLDLI